MQQKENTVPIIEPVARELLLAELTPARKMRNTHRAGNEIYIFSAAECPSLMREVGRLREAAFRGAGGGTGQEVDIDEEVRFRYQTPTPAQPALRPSWTSSR